MFDIGEDVVCVDNRPKRGDFGAIVPVHQLLEVGRIYRITGFHWPIMARNMITGEEIIKFDPSVSLVLHGIVLPPPMGGFSAYRFRKLLRSSSSTSSLAVKKQVLKEDDLVQGIDA